MNKSTDLLARKRAPVLNVGDGKRVSRVWVTHCDGIEGLR
jgi:hypothetical protein